jgi:hypothetical protein
MADLENYFSGSIPDKMSIDCNREYRFQELRKRIRIPLISTSPEEIQPQPKQAPEREFLQKAPKLT